MKKRQNKMGLKGIYFKTFEFYSFPKINSVRILINPWLI